MSQRSPFLPTGDAPLRARLVLGWGLFFALVIVGIGLVLMRGRSVPVLLDAMPR
jgi:hypothetical protein